MEFGIVRIEKYGSSSVRNIQQHDRREKKEYETNKNIDKRKSHLNYNLHNGNDDISFYKKITAEIRKLMLKRKVRKDATYMTQAMVTASPHYFKGKTQEEIKEYFVECYNFLSKKYGKDNIVSAIVHLDEKTPHMHFNFVPITKDKRLSAKSLFTPSSLKELQTSMHKSVFSKFGLARGIEKSDAKHLSTLNLKIITAQQELKHLEYELSVANEKANNNEMYQLIQKHKSLAEKLKKMFEVLESDPDLMKEYKKAIARLQQKEKEEKEEREI